MAFLHNIRTVARYEAKTLRRSWFFRLFSLYSVHFHNIKYRILSPIGDENWEMIAIPSSVPLTNLYLLNIGQAIVVIFLAADFLKEIRNLIQMKFYIPGRCRILSMLSERPGGSCVSSLVLLFCHLLNGPAYEHNIKKYGN